MCQVVGNCWNSFWDQRYGECHCLYSPSHIDSTEGIKLWMPTEAQGTPEELPTQTQSTYLRSGSAIKVPHTVHSRTPVLYPSNPQPHKVPPAWHTLGLPHPVLTWLSASQSHQAHTVYPRDGHSFKTGRRGVSHNS